MHRTHGNPAGSGASLRTVNAKDIQRFLLDTGLTFCELLTLARGANGSEALLQRRLAMIGLNAEEIDRAVMSKLASHSADDVARYAKRAAWPPVS